jgi:membrane fusion protein, copper/silver efflux system
MSPSVPDRRWSSAGAGGGAAPPEPAAPGAPPPRHDPPPPGAGFMNALRWAMFAGLVVLAAVAIGSVVLSKRGGPTSAAGRPLYQCPMHPTFTSTDPAAECSICGMDLVAVGNAGGVGAALPEGDVPGLTGVHVAPERLRQIGVRLAVVERLPLGSGLDLVAFVTPDEARVRQVQLRVSGWVRDLRVGRTGEHVTAGEPLLTIESPELRQSEEEFLLALESSLAGGHAHEAGALVAARERLAFLGVPAVEITRLERERTARAAVPLVAPFSGTVIERRVSEGQSVGPDTPLLTLADLRSVWVLADAYEMDLPRVRAGVRAAFTADAIPGRTFGGRVDFVYPTVSPETRTVKVRIVADNPRGDLKPGMFGRVRLEGRDAAVLSVPAEAVVYTGEGHYAFVARAGGIFEPRAITVGARGTDRIEILRGLAEGDTVVGSASFLIDSESRLRSAVAGKADSSAGAPVRSRP